MKNNGREQIKKQIARTLDAHLLEDNNEATRSKLKVVLESVVPDSYVDVQPIDPTQPRLLQGTLSHADLEKAIHFEISFPQEAEICLTCGEAADHARMYGCVAGFHDCPYEAEL
jgi:hypothetical protein